MTDEQKQHELAMIDIHRKNIRIYQRQLAILGVNTPSHVIYSIDSSRESIARSKEYLSKNGVKIEDISCDFLTEDEKNLGVGQS